MDSSSLASDTLSPESTVTSLLSSSGHLRSSQLPPERSPFRYGDKSYDSASAALDAYIADFEMNQQTGGLFVPHTPHCKPSTLRNRDVLRESLTDRELDFLNLPVSSLRHRDNRDRLSMTTNELLSIPQDGSLPVTHTSAFIQGLMSQSGASQPHSSFRPVHRTWTGLRSSHSNSHMNHHHPHLTQMPRSSRCRRRLDAASSKTHDDILSVSRFKLPHRAAEPSTLCHLPHWFSSNKADVDCSGISSVPDLKYPDWLHQCDLSDPPPPQESELWHHQATRTRAPSWVAELEDDDPKQTLSQADSQQTLRDLRLQFAEQISLLTAGTKKSGIIENLFRDNRIESLIHKAELVLNSLSQTCSCEDIPAGSVATEDQMLRLLSQTQQRPVDSAAAAAARITEARTDRGAQDPGCGLHENTLTQPGPVEALKQMLFRLQSVEAELHRQQLATAAEGKQTRETPVKQDAPEDEGELEGCSGGPSLQRALHHLSRLKLLVEEPRAKSREKEEDRDDDEGLCSSSSVDGLICSPHKPC